MADILKDSYDESKRFVKVIFQRNRNIIDADLNELQDNTRVEKYRTARAIGGDGSPDNGLAIEANGETNTVTLRAGTFQAAGYHLLFEEDLTFNSLTTNSGPGDRTDILYLALSEAEVADPNPIAELGETTRRRQVITQFAVAEGSDVPDDSDLEVWQGGTKYIPIASIIRPAANAVINPGQVTDLRGVMPSQTLKTLTRRDTNSGQPKVFVRARDAEGLNNSQIAVQAQNGSLVFNVDRAGNLTTTGTLNPFRCASLQPAANNTFDLGGTSNAWRTLYVGQSTFLGDNYTSATQVQGDAVFLNQGGTPGLQINGITGNVTIGGSAIAEDAGRTLAAQGNVKFYGSISAGNFDSNITPDVDVFRNLGSTSARWANVYAATSLSNTARINTLTAYAGSGGQLTVSSSLSPSSGSLNLGTSSTGWANGYFTALQATTSLTVAASGNLLAPTLQHPTGTSTAVVAKSSINPSVTNTLSLGTGSAYWQAVYGNTLYANQANLGGVQTTGNIYPGNTNTLDVGTASQYFANARATNLLGATLGPLSGSTLSVTGNLIPAAHQTQSLGNSGTWWNTVYASNVSAGLYTNNGAPLNADNSILPNTTATQDLGSTTKIWNTLFVNNVYSGYTSANSAAVAINGNLCLGTNANSAFNARVHIAAPTIDTNTAPGASVHNAIFRMGDGNATILRIMNWRYATGSTGDTVDQYLAKRTDATDNGFLAWYSANGRMGQVGIGLGIGTPGNTIAKFFVGNAQNFSGQHLLPDANAVYDLGSTGYRWASVYATSMSVTSFSTATMTLSNDGGVGSPANAGTTPALTILPTTNAGRMRLAGSTQNYIDFYSGGNPYVSILATNGTSFSIYDWANNRSVFNYNSALNTSSFAGPVDTGALSFSSAKYKGATTQTSWQSPHYAVLADPGVGTIRFSTTTGALTVQAAPEGSQAFIPIRVPRQCVIVSVTVYGLVTGASGTTSLQLRKTVPTATTPFITSTAIAANTVPVGGSFTSVLNATTGQTIAEADTAYLSLLVSIPANILVAIHGFSVTYTVTDMTPSTRG